jgi:hypothetical protein
MRIKVFFLLVFLFLLLNLKLISAVYERDRYCEQINFQSRLNNVTQTFIPTKNNIVKIDVNLRKGRDSDFTIVILLKDCDGEVLGTSSTLDSSQMIKHKYTFEWYKFNFTSPVEVTPNKKYEINLICEGDCGRLSTTEDQIAYTYTNEDDCDPTGYMNVCNGTQKQDLSFRTYYDTEYEPKKSENFPFILIIIPVVIIVFLLLRSRR